MPMLPHPCNWVHLRRQHEGTLAIPLDASFLCWHLAGHLAQAWFAKKWTYENKSQNATMLFYFCSHHCILISDGFQMMRWVHTVGPYCGSVGPYCASNVLTEILQTSQCKKGPPALLLASERGAGKRPCGAEIYSAELPWCSGLEQLSQV